MNKKARIIVMLFVLVLLLMGGAFGTIKYLKYKEQLIGNYDSHKKESGNSKKVIDDYEKKLSKMEDTLETASKAALEAVEEYRKTNQNIIDEEAYYQTYIEYLRAGMRDNFQTVTFVDLDVTMVIKGGETYTLGYNITDINLDGVKELLLGINWEDGSSVIYGIYSIQDGKMICIANGWLGNEYYLCENGAIANESESGVCVSYYKYYTYENGALDIIEAVSRIGDWKMNREDMPWFYSKVTQASEHDVQISEESAQEIINSYKYIGMDFTPIICE